MFILDVSETTLVAGTAVADASILLRGSDIGLESDDEEIRAVAIGPGNVIHNSPPTDFSPGSFNVDENVDTSSGYSLGTLTATDPDVGETFTWSVLPGLDDDKLSIGGVANDELILTDGTAGFRNGI